MLETAIDALDDPHKAELAAKLLNAVKDCKLSILAFLDELSDETHGILHDSIIKQRDRYA